MKFGELEIIEQPELTKLPQRAASAFSAVNKLVGAGYKAVAYIGTQITKGVNYVFIAEQNLTTSAPERHIVLITIHEFNGNYNVVGIERIA